MLHRGMSGASTSGSGIPADYGADAGNPTPDAPPGPTPAPAVSNGVAFTDTQPPLDIRDDVPSIRSSGDGSVPLTQDGGVSLTQSQGNTPVPTITTHNPTDAHANPITYAPNMEVATGERPEEIIEEVIPVCNESVEEHRLAAITQQLLKMVEAAVNPAQGTHFQLISVGVNVKECLLPGDKGAQLAMLNIHAFLISVDVFQQEGKFPAAMTLMAKVSYVFVGSQSAITWEGGFAYALAS